MKESGFSSMTATNDKMKIENSWKSEYKHFENSLNNEYKHFENSWINECKHSEMIIKISQA